MTPNAAYQKILGSVTEAEARGNARLDQVEAKLDKLLELLDRPAEQPPAPAPTTPRKAR